MSVPTNEEDYKRLYGTDRPKIMTENEIDRMIGRLDIMNENLISIIKLLQRSISSQKGTTTTKMYDGSEIEISECFEDNEGYIHHIDWCKGECNL